MTACPLVRRRPRSMREMTEVAWGAFVMPAFGPLVVSALCPVPLVERTPATIHVVERGRRGTGHETPRRVLHGSGGEAGERAISRLGGWGPLEKVE